ERSVAAVRALQERGQGQAAVQQVELLVAQHPESVEAQRLRQDILRGRGRTALLRSEAAARVAAAPGDGIAHYLFGRVQLPGSDQRSAFRRAAELAPHELWPWLGFAYALRTDEVDEALAIYERLYDESARHPLVGVAYAQLLRNSGRLRE